MAALSPIWYHRLHRLRSSFGLSFDEWRANAHIALSSPGLQNGLFYLGLGLASSFAISAMRRMLIHYREAAIVPSADNTSQYITQKVEDSLKLSTLDKLLDSSNYCIQETATIIICERALHDGTTINALLWHITRPEHESRDKGIRALSMMMNNEVTITMLNTDDTYSALVKSLEYSVTDYKHNECDPDWDNWSFRDSAEKFCLMILGSLVNKYGPGGIIKQRFVERWLAKEPWGETDEKRIANFERYLQKGHRLNELNGPLFRYAAGRKQLIKAKLLPAEALNLPRDVRMINGEGTAGEGTAGEEFDGVIVESRRRRDQSSEEEHIRRRHREAIVMNDGTRPLGRGDIIQRERQSSI